MIIADTSAVLALIDADDQHHEAVRRWYDAEPDNWVLPWAVLPEIDYLLLSHVGARAELAFVEDIAEERYIVEWGHPADVVRAGELCRKYRSLQLGLVDAVVMAIAERKRANAIATLDLRHFAAVKLLQDPLLLPRDG